MSFRKLLSRKLLSSVVATSLAVSTIFTAAMPLASATSPQPQLSETADAADTAEKAENAETATTIDATENAETAGVQNTVDASATTGNVADNVSEGTAESVATGQVPEYKQPVQLFRAMSPLSSQYPAIPDPSDLTDWVTYDHYYNPSSSWSSAGAPGWDADAGGGYHPFFYWKETYTSYNNKYYDLDTAADKARMQTEVFDIKGGAPSLLDTPTVAHFSKHIYTEGNSNNAKITFVGYGSTFKTDWAISQTKVDDFKSVGFDIDASLVNAHTLSNFGIMVNSGVDRTTDTLKGYVIAFRMANTTQGTKNGTFELIDISSGTNASALHDGLTGSRLLQDVGKVTKLGTFDLKKSDVGKVRVDIDIETTQLNVKLTYYNAGLATNTEEHKVNLPTDTKQYGYGPVVNYNGSGHTCARLSSVTFSNALMSIHDYSVIFDKNGGDTDASPARIDYILRGESLDDAGHTLPTPPTRNGYTFKGWNVKQDGSGATFSENDPINKITIVYAQWEKNPEHYTITYKSGGNGSLSGSTSETVLPGGSPVSVPTPVPDAGYKFMGWRTEGVSGLLSEADIKALTINANKEFVAVFDDLDNYTIDFVAGPNGSLSGTPTLSVQEGSPIAATPTPTPDKYYKFDGWKVTGDPNTYSTAQIEAMVPTGDMTITAEFSIDPVQVEYTVTYKAGPNGTLQGNTSETVVTGGNVKDVPTPVPDAKYQFEGWRAEGSSTVYSTAQIEAMAITSDTTFTAVFDIDPGQIDYTVSYVAGANGSLNGSASEVVRTGGSPVSVPTPAADKYYKFDGWSVPGQSGLLSTADVEALVITGDITITAEFAIDPLQTEYTVTYAAGANGSLNGVGSEIVVSGGSVQNVPTPTPDAKYQFEGWQAAGSSTLYSTAQLEALVITGDVTFTAVFDIDPGQVDYTVSYAAGANGSLNGGASEVVRTGGSPVSVPTPVADKYYKFDGWSVPGQSGLLTTADVEALVITGDITITAEFVIDPLQTEYTVTYLAGANGSLNGAGSEIVVSGGNVKNVPTPVADAKYKFEGWQAAGSSTLYSTAQLASLTITGDVTFTAVFDIDPGQIDYTVQYVAGANGSLNGNTSEVVRTGGSVQDVPTPVPDAKYKFEGWQAAGSSTLYSTAQLEALVITGDVTFTAVFAIDPDQIEYTVSYAAGANGSLNGSATELVKAGNSPANVPAPVADKYYKFDGWKVSGNANLLSTADVEALVITSNITVTAEFSLDPAQTEFTVTYKTGPNGKLQGNATETVTMGNSPANVPTPVADQYYKFAGWTAAGSSTLYTTAQLETLKINADVTFTATFELDPDQVEYTVTYKAGANGTLQGSKQEQVKFGDSPANVPTPVPSQYYTFEGWTVEGSTRLYSTAQLEQLIIKGDVTFTAQFDYDPTAVEYTVTYATGINGTLQGTTREKVKAGGSPVSVPTVVPNAGYAFKGWESSIDSQLYSTADVEDMRINANVKFTARYEKDPLQGSYTISYKTGTNGTLQGNITETVRYGKSPVSVPTAIPNSGYVFKGWERKSDGNILSTAAVEALTITANETFTARYQVDKNQSSYTVTYKSGSNGVLQGKTVENVLFNQSPTSIPTPQPNSGYVFKGWENSLNKNILSTAELSAYKVTKAVTFTARYEKDTANAKYTVSYASGPNGSLKGVSFENVLRGGSPVNVPTAVPNTGYTFKGWERGSDSRIFTTSEVEALQITANVKFTARYTKVTPFTVTYRTNGYGTLTGNATEKVIPGGSPNAVPTPVAKDGYELAYWKDQDGVQYASISDIHNIVVNSNITITAYFNPVEKVSVTYLAKANGYLSGNNAEWVLPGKSPVSVPNPMANKGFEFKYWQDDNGATYASNDDVKKAVINYDTIFYAIFDVPSGYTLTFVSGPNGTLKGSTVETVAPGQGPTVIPTPVPNEGYQFAYWQADDGTKYMTDVDLMLMSAKKDTKIAAVFTTASHDVRFIAGANGALSGGTVVESIKNGGYLTTIPSPVPNNGYTFKCWEDQNGKQYTTTQLKQLSIRTPYIFTAVFESTAYTVEYHAGLGGSINGAKLEIVTNGRLKNVPIPVPSSGYTFKYWEDQNGKQYQNSSALRALTITGDMIFTAVFDEETFQINYTVNDPSRGTLEGTTSYTGLKGGDQISQVAPAPLPVAKEGYVFVGWINMNGTYITPNNTIVSSSTTSITAVFKTDSNGDGIPDDNQQKVIIRLEPKGPGSFGANDVTSYTVVLNSSGIGYFGKTAGFAIPQLIPNTSVDPTVKFFYWEDEDGKEIKDILTYELRKNTTIFAFFDTDKDGDGIPDSKQPKKYTVSIKVKGNGSLQGQTQFTVNGVINGNATLGSAVGGFTAPTPVATTSGYVFYRWEDANGNAITSLKDFVISGDCVIYARFDEDTNGDGIADAGQKKYILTLKSGNGGYLVGGTVHYTLIGGDVNDKNPLTLDNVVGQFIVPAIVANPGFEFAGWVPFLNFESHSLQVFEDTTVTATFRTTVNRLTFVTNNDTVVGEFSAKQGETISDIVPDTITEPTAPEGYKFAGWKDEDGKTTTTAQIMTMTLDDDMKFTAVFDKE